MRVFVDLVANVAANEFPTEHWVQIGLVGEWKGHPAGAYKLAAADLQSIADYFANRFLANNADLVVDYEHQSLGSDVAPAAGWIDQIETRWNGTQLWAHVRWNSNAARLLVNREYRYLSPVFGKAKKDGKTGEKWPWIIDSVALTNKPFLTELPAVVNATTAAGTGSTVANEEEEAMELLTLLATAMGMEPAALAEMLGVAADAGNEDIAKGIASKMQGMKANSETAAAAGARVKLFANAFSLKEDADEATVTAEAKKLSGASVGLLLIANSLGMAGEPTADAIIAELGKRTKGAEESKAETLIANAVREGKVTPAQKDRFLELARRDYAMAEGIIANSARVIAQPSGATGALPVAGGSLSAEERAICAQMGVAEKDFIASRG